MVGCHEPTTTQLSLINSVIALRSFTHRLGSQCLDVALQPKVPTRVVEELTGFSAEVAHSRPPPTSVLKDVERCIVGTFKQVIAPVITCLAAMDKRLSRIESRQDALEQTLKDGREDIMERIDDVEWDLVVELKKKS